jgi:hypothetical protein
MVQYELPPLYALSPHLNILTEIMCERFYWIWPCQGTKFTVLSLPVQTVFPDKDKLASEGSFTQELFVVLALSLINAISIERFLSFQIAIASRSETSI